MKKIILLLIIFFECGCMKYTELNDLGIIKSIGITYVVYAQIYDEVKKNNDPKTKIIIASGKTINNAFNKINLMIDKEIFLSHIDLLIIDSNLKNNNYQEIINYFLKKDLRNDFHCIYSNNIKTLLENNKTDAINTFIKNNKKGTILKISFDEVINNYLNQQPIKLSMINYHNTIKYNGNYQYFNNHLERINNDEN